jgi:hypothetical protein
MENLKRMKECLTCMVEEQIYGNIDKVDTKELGEAIDMIKDLAETIYYCTITEAMEGEEEDDRHGKMYYAPREYYDPRYGERCPYDIMYAQRGGKGAPNGGGGGRGTMYTDHVRVNYPENIEHVYRDGVMRDPHEGKSGQRRKMYMEGQKMHYDKTKQMQELEAYMQELAQDMSEMIQEASPEEKQLLQQKIATLASKVK